MRSGFLLLQIWISELDVVFQVLNDLFDANKTNLKVREHKLKGVHVEGLTEVELESAEQALALIETGNANRRVYLLTSYLP